MSHAKPNFLSFIASLLILTACESSETANAQPNDEETPLEATKSQEPHRYGGWYCPDNFGFEPMDIQEVKNLVAITDRLPTKEETSNGSSLIFVDAEKYPDARPLEMNLPRVARIKTSASEPAELIIIIQAIVVQNDTVVGYRFPSGGNGSARIGDVSFLSDDEVSALGPAPMVYMNTEIKASMKAIWKSITETDYARELGLRFNQVAFFQAEWSEESRVHLEFETETSSASGFVGNHFGNLYLHIDYYIEGVQYTEKLLVGEQEDGFSELHVAAGPVPEGFASKKQIWENFLQEVKKNSEAE